MKEAGSISAAGYCGSGSAAAGFASESSASSVKTATAVPHFAASSRRPKTKRW